MLPKCHCYLLFAVPSKPLNLTVLGVTEDSMNIRWMEPERANGAIEGYRIYYMFANYTDVQTLKLANGSPNIYYTLKNLSKFRMITVVPKISYF